MNAQALSVTSVHRLNRKTVLKGCGSGCLLLLFFSISAFADTHYVSLSGSHTVPFTNWATAARDIQAAIDAASAGDTILVTNGVYDTGGKVLQGGTLTNRVVIDKAVRIRSVNGPDVTVVSGNGSARCFYLSNTLVLVSGFTITGGMTRYQMGYSDKLDGGVCTSITVAQWSIASSRGIRLVIMTAPRGVGVCSSVVKV